MAYRCRLKDKILYGNRTCIDCEGYLIDSEKPACYATEGNLGPEWVYNCSEVVWQEGVLKNKKALHTVPYFIVNPHIQGAKLELLYKWGENGKLWFTELRSPDEYFHLRPLELTLNELGLNRMMTTEEMKEVSKRHKVSPKP